VILRALGAAVAFLTRVPRLARFQYTGADLVRGAPAFPLVGAAIGALVGGAVVAGTGLGLPVLLAATLAIGLEVILTGALHLDGLADSADGLAGRTPERRLQIMRDPGIGVYGTAAVVLDLLVNVVAVGSLPRADVMPVLIAIYAVSRAAPLPLAAALPYAGTAGTGKAFVDGVGWARAAAGVGVAAVVAVVAVGAWALALPATLVVVGAAVAVGSHRRLRGMTGDVLGAAVELVVLACLVVSVVGIGMTGADYRLSSAERVISTATSSAWASTSCFVDKLRRYVPEAGVTAQAGDDTPDTGEPATCVTGSTVTDGLSAADQGADSRRTPQGGR
jgi:adenosylcobinamide-GDP ribazoletransferase